MQLSRPPTTDAAVGRGHHFMGRDMNTDPVNPLHWIPTFSEYIREYIHGVRGRHIPGEHHFVSVYLVPRLVALEGLGVPCYVNPDGMKAIPGDVVYYDRHEPEASSAWKLRLGIEAKIGSVKFSRTEYNDWMRPHAATEQKPDLFVGISKDGLLIGRWEPFARRFVRIAYGENAPEVLDPSSSAERYTLARDLLKIVRDLEEVLPTEERPLPEGLRWWPYSEDREAAERYEADALRFLAEECRLASDNHRSCRRAARCSPLSPAMA